ncbi:MAG TPA: hypothetical protein VN729_07540 [Ktedonobacteraceae bacterium]|nr:hypothetical protein [Ktedonobacteraceae bacterium]
MPGVNEQWGSHYVVEQREKGGHVLEARHPSAGRDQEIQRLTAMKILVEQTFPLTQDEMAEKPIL